MYSLIIMVVAFILYLTEPTMGQTLIHTFDIMGYWFAFITIIAIFVTMFIMLFLIAITVGAFRGNIPVLGAITLGSIFMVVVGVFKLGLLWYLSNALMNSIDPTITSLSLLDEKSIIMIVIMIILILIPYGKFTMEFSKKS